MSENLTTTPASGCAEAGCTAPRRVLLRSAGGVYVSDWCWAHAPRCLLCHGEIDDGEDLCEAHAERLGVRYEHELEERVQTAFHTALHARDGED